jgi:hypothetical protein
MFFCLGSSAGERESVISARLMNEDPDLPSSASVANHFGRLSAAYQLIGVVRLEGKPIRFGLPPRTWQSAR